MNDAAHQRLLDSCAVLLGRAVQASRDLEKASEEANVAGLLAALLVAPAAAEAAKHREALLAVVAMAEAAEDAELAEIVDLETIRRRRALN